MNLIPLLLSFTMLACMAGVIEAILYSKKGADAFKMNEHILYFIQRGLETTLPIMTTIQNTSPWDCVIVMGYHILAFSFFHNGCYYETRSRIDVKQYNFFSSSTTSTAIFELNLLKRTILFILSILLVLGYTIWK